MSKNLFFLRMMRYLTWLPLMRELSAKLTEGETYPNSTVIIQIITQCLMV